MERNGMKAVQCCNRKNARAWQGEMLGSKRIPGIGLAFAGANKSWHLLPGVERQKRLFEDPLSSRYRYMEWWRRYPGHGLRQWPGDLIWRWPLVRILGPPGYIGVQVRRRSRCRRSKWKKESNCSYGAKKVINEMAGNRSHKRKEREREKIGNVTTLVNWQQSSCALLHSRVP